MGLVSRLAVLQRFLHVEHGRAVLGMGFVLRNRIDIGRIELHDFLEDRMDFFRGFTRFFAASTCFMALS